MGTLRPLSTNNAEKRGSERIFSGCRTSASWISRENSSPRPDPVKDRSVTLTRLRNRLLSPLLPGDLPGTTISSSSSPSLIEKIRAYDSSIKIRVYDWSVQIRVYDFSVKIRVYDWCVEIRVFDFLGLVVILSGWRTQLLLPTTRETMWKVKNQRERGYWFVKAQGWRFTQRSMRSCLGTQNEAGLALLMAMLRMGNGFMIPSRVKLVTSAGFVYSSLYS